jgi:RBB1NT (NUC162) domain
VSYYFTRGVSIKLTVFPLFSYTVPKKEAFEFTREVGAKVDNNSLRSAVEKAVLFLDSDELPPHWDRDLLFGLQESSDSDSNDGSDSEVRYTQLAFEL